jgi:hypothetical protein
MNFSDLLLPYFIGQLSFVSGLLKDTTNKIVYDIVCYTVSEMLDESREIERIFKAEIARELGEFDKCLQLLSHSFEKKLQYLASFIRKRALEGDRDVWPLM